MKRILVIEDDADVKDVICLYLEAKGYDVVSAANGEEAVDLYRDTPADLVITDIIMPEKEGIETIEEFRRDFPEAQIIAISGAGRGGAQDYLMVAEMLGAVRTFTKPFKMEQLLEAVRQIVG